MSETSPTALIDTCPIGSRWRHKKRGSEYEVVSHAEVQCEAASGDGLTDFEVVIVYRGIGDDRAWVRRPSEFLDGRFERLAHRSPDADAVERAQYADQEQHERDIVDGLIAAHPDKAEQARATISLQGWFVGQTVRALHGVASAPRLAAYVATALSRPQQGEPARARDVFDGIFPAEPDKPPEGHEGYHEGSWRIGFHAGSVVTEQILAQATPSPSGELREAILQMIESMTGLNSAPNGKQEKLADAIATFAASHADAAVRAERERHECEEEFLQHTIDDLNGMRSDDAADLTAALDRVAKAEGEAKRVRNGLADDGAYLFSRSDSGKHELTLGYQTSVGVSNAHAVLAGFLGSPKDRVAE